MSSRANRPSAPRPASDTTLAVVDMGSNSFRLELGRVQGHQIFPLDTWRETLRIGSQLDASGRLTPEGQAQAIACLARFSERLRGLHPSAVRAVATNVFRVATNSAKFLAKAERALGFPIDVITGHEEARLIYAGVVRVLPPASEPRLVIDIGGGSTEFIIGRGFTPARLESLSTGCVSMTNRFFADGRFSEAAFRAAETDARAHISSIATQFSRAHWDTAFASSGTALALADIARQNGFSASGITREALIRLRKHMIAAGGVRRLRLAALKPQRAGVLAGGLAIMNAALAELDADVIHPVGGAMRLGVLYDLLGRTEEHDARVETVEQFMRRYDVDREHAQRVARLAVELFRHTRPKADAVTLQRLSWAALLHEVGISVSHTGFHKHGAYILRNADMPGFSDAEQETLSQLVLGCRGGLAKMDAWLRNETFRAKLFCLRLAVLLYHARRPIELPAMKVRANAAVGVRVPRRWLAEHPLTDHLLDLEAQEWAAAGYVWSSR